MRFPGGARRGNGDERGLPASGLRVRWIAAGAVVIGLSCVVATHEWIRAALGAELTRALGEGLPVAGILTSARGRTPLSRRSSG